MVFLTHYFKKRHHHTLWLARQVTQWVQTSRPSSVGRGHNFPYDTTDRTQHPRLPPIRRWSGIPAPTARPADCRESSMAGWGSADGVDPCLLPCKQGRAQMLMNTAPYPTPGKLSWGPVWCGEPLPGFRHLVLKPTGDGEDQPPPSAKVICLAPSWKALRQVRAAWVRSLTHLLHSTSLGLRPWLSLKACRQHEKYGHYCTLCSCPSLGTAHSGQSFCNRGLAPGPHL